MTCAPSGRLRRGAGGTPAIGVPSASFAGVARLGQSIGWDGADEYEPTKLDIADAFERAGHLEAAAELRAEWDAEEEQRELEALAEELARQAAEHELRSERAKRAVQTRKQRQAERRAAVTAAEDIIRAAHE